MALFEKFGEFNSAEEIEKAAAGLIEEGDKESLLILAKENGFDEMDVEDWMDYGAEISDEEAAVAKLKVEEESLNLPASSLIHDWVDYIRKMSIEDNTIAKAVRSKEKSLTECLSKILKKSFENQWSVPSQITKDANVSAGRVTFGITNETATRKIIREYYGGKA